MYNTELQKTVAKQYGIFQRCDVLTTQNVTMKFSATFHLKAMSVKSLDMEINDSRLSSTPEAEEFTSIVTGFTNFNQGASQQGLGEPSPLQNFQPFYMAVTLFSACRTTFCNNA